MLRVETRLKPKQVFTMRAGCCRENPIKLRDAPVQKKRQMHGRRPCQKSAKSWVIKELVSSRSKSQSKRRALKLRAGEAEVGIRPLAWGQETRTQLPIPEEQAAQPGVTGRTLLHSWQRWQQLARLTGQCCMLGQLFMGS